MDFTVLALVCLFKPPKQLRLSYGTSGLSTMYVQMVGGHWTSSIQLFFGISKRTTFN